MLFVHSSQSSKIVSILIQHSSSSATHFGIQNAIIKFEDTQKKAQGSLRFIDIFLFPAGTIVASGPSCSEQGSGRWLPKPSDTFNKFILMSKPSVGYKDIPLLWIDMVDVSKMIGFILPDWIADILPGDYPIHNNFLKTSVFEKNCANKIFDEINKFLGTRFTNNPLGNILINKRHYLLLKETHSHLCLLENLVKDNVHEEFILQELKLSLTPINEIIGFKDNEELIS